LVKALTTIRAALACHSAAKYLKSATLVGGELDPLA